MSRPVTDELIERIDDDEFHVYDLLMDLIYWIGEEKIAEFVKKTNAFPE